MCVCSPNIGEPTSTFISEKLSISSPISGERMSSLKVGICSPHMREHNVTFKTGICSPDTEKYLPTFYAIFRFHYLSSTCIWME